MNNLDYRTDETLVRFSAERTRIEKDAIATATEISTVETELAIATANADTLECDSIMNPAAGKEAEKARRSVEALAHKLGELTTKAGRCKRGAGELRQYARTRGPHCRPQSCRKSVSRIRPLPFDSDLCAGRR